MPYIGIMSCIMREREIQWEKHGSVCGQWISRAIFLGVTPFPQCRQSPCQYSGWHHLSGLALGLRQSPLWSRLDFVADQWDLWGQIDCHCILPCTLPKTQFGWAAPHLYFTCLNPDEDKTGGRLWRSNSGKSSSDFIQPFSKC